MEIFEILGISLYKFWKIFGNLIPLKPKLMDMCWNSCCTLVKKKYIDCEICLLCEEPQYLSKKYQKRLENQLLIFP